MFPSTSSRETLRLSGKQNSLFPSGAHIKCIMYMTSHENLHTSDFTRESNSFAIKIDSVKYKKLRPIQIPPALKIVKTGKQEIGNFNILILGSVVQSLICFNPRLEPSVFCGFCISTHFFFKFEEQKLLLIHAGCLKKCF